MSFREHLLQKKNVFFWALPELPLPQFRQLVPLFLDVKNDVLMRITEPSNNDYDNDVSDNFDHNFGTFDDFGVKHDQKVSNNMILMSKYKGKHGGKKGQQKFIQEGFPKVYLIVLYLYTLVATGDVPATL